MSFVPAGILKIWRGENSLFRSFWLYFYLCNNFVIAIAAVLILPLQTVGLLEAGKLFVLALWVLYLFVTAVGVWRSAGHYTGRRIWAVLARLFSCLSAFLAILNFAMIATRPL